VLPGGRVVGGDGPRGVPVAHGRAARAEHDQAEGEGSVFEGWGGGHQVKDGISGPVWSEQKDWSAKKAEVIEPMQNVCKMLDQLLNQTLGDAQTVPADNGAFSVRVGGGCADLRRIYEYFGATLAAQMGAPASLPAWAENRGIDLGLDKLGASQAALRAAVVVDCASAPLYRIVNGNVTDAASGREVSYSIPWPPDRSVLLTHVMKASSA
jgi:hypothetical protein